MQLAHNEKIAVSNTAGPTHVTYCDLHYVTLHNMRNAKCEMPSLLEWDQGRSVKPVSFAERFDSSLPTNGACSSMVECLAVNQETKDRYLPCTPHPHSA
jgi:hypothetical protein